MRSFVHTNGDSPEWNMCGCDQGAAKEPKQVFFGEEFHWFAPSYQCAHMPVKDVFTQLCKE
jgi:hypothetical protein